MPRASMLPIVLRELLGPREFPREPEPALVMHDPEQVAAYEHAGRADGVMAAAYVFHAARVSRVISGADCVVDLGCGPATQLVQIARLHPRINFIGIDLSEEMLARGRKQVLDNGLTNVELRCDSMTQLASLPDHSADAVISTMALHHLPTLDDLSACFGHVARVLRRDGGIYLADFARLKSLRSVLYFAYQNARHQPHLFSLDYERSLRAAFEVCDLRKTSQQHLGSQASLFTTFLVPVLAVIKTPDRPLTQALSQELRSLRAGLPARYRRDLDDIRLFFRFGGLTGDPFSSNSAQG
jgi:ubiquinone/menaquinone biosynthesis C-methylase UbiE